MIIGLNRAYKMKTGIRYEFIKVIDRVITFILCKGPKYFCHFLRDLPSLRSLSSA